MHFYLNYISLLAQYHTWQAKLEEKPPNFTLLLRVIRIKLLVMNSRKKGGGGGFLLQIVFKLLFPVPLIAKIICPIINVKIWWNPLS